jgi:hypothetical protein
MVEEFSTITVNKHILKVSCYKTWIYSISYTLPIINILQNYMLKASCVDNVPA